jgi:hypothetical protein
MKIYMAVWEEMGERIQTYVVTMYLIMDYDAGSEYFWRM